MTGLSVEPGVTEVEPVDDCVARGAGVVVLDGTAEFEGTDEGTDDGADVLVCGAGCAPGRDECDSLCEANRIATLSNATVNVTRRLNRISSTRNALVCTK
jgi:hypothetical protein